LLSSFFYGYSHLWIFPLAWCFFYFFCVSRYRKPLKPYPDEVTWWSPFSLHIFPRFFEVDPLSNSHKQKMIDWWSMAPNPHDIQPFFNVDLIMSNGMNRMLESWLAAVLHALLVFTQDESVSAEEADISCWVDEDLVDDLIDVGWCLRIWWMMLEDTTHMTVDLDKTVEMVGGGWFWGTQIQEASRGGWLRETWQETWPKRSLRHLSAVFWSVFPWNLGRCQGTHNMGLETDPSGEMSEKSVGKTSQIPSNSRGTSSFSTVVILSFGERKNSSFRLGGLMDSIVLV
jgi:hypothetical protein